MQKTTTTFATNTPNQTTVTNAQSNFTGGFDSDGHLWVSNGTYGCLTRMNVGGTNPIALGSYQLDGAFSDGVPFFGILVDGDRVVGQAIAYESGLRTSWFFCFPTDLSVDTIDQSGGDLFAREFGIGSGNLSGSQAIKNFNVYTTNNEGSWGSASTTSVGITVNAYTGSYDYDAAAAVVDQRMAASSIGIDVIRSSATLSAS